MRRLAVLLGSLVLAPAAASAAPQCWVVDVQMQPRDKEQIVAWIEDTNGAYVDTIFITQQTGRFGLGNRPGRYDFNSGPRWPYGRRVNTFPVWSHRHGQTFKKVVFQDGAEDNLSHSSDQSSAEDHYCRPTLSTEMAWTLCDANTSATPAMTDKGKYSDTDTSFYPPRADLMRQTCNIAPPCDSGDVDMYQTADVFDVISQATPAAGTLAQMSWAVPRGVDAGMYTLYVEVSEESEFNSTYNQTTYPSPTGISYKDYGLAYRGQPSVVYSAPFQIALSDATTTGTDYIGYGDPTGSSGALTPPDATIDTAAGRLEMLAGQTYRVSVHSHASDDMIAPAAPDAMSVISVTGSSALFKFVAPGDDGHTGTVTGYEVRYLANQEMTADNFAAGQLYSAGLQPAAAGTIQTLELDNLLPLTDYWVGIRAFDECQNESPVAIVHVTTADRAYGEVDACFVATAAYGTAMANDVALLRRFRDAALRQTVLGELGVEVYYTFGPALAGVVGESDMLRNVVRDLLAPIIERVRALAF